MKTYPYSTGLPLPVHIQHAYHKLLLFLLFIIIGLCSFAQSGGGLLTFRNATLVSGTAGEVGAVYQFPQVTNDVDALVTITSKSDPLVYLVNIDMITSGFDKAWQPQVGYNSGTAPGPADWNMEFEMSFVRTATSNPVTIEEFNLSAIDIDGNGHLIQEYVSFLGLTSYTLETSSMLLTTDIFGLVGGINTLIGKRFDGPTSNYTNIDTSGTSVMTTAKYLNTQKFSIRAGGVSTGVSGASERMYSFYFQSFKYSQPKQATLPVKLKSFDAKLVSAVAVLSWQSEMEKEFSHYVVEKSTDGKAFHYLTMVFANEQQSTGLRYSYSENLAKSASGMLYYRLKMVDTDGTYSYSHVRMLKLQAPANQAAIAAYPNPVVSELRITIPANWQDQRVVYDMFSANGKMVKRMVSNHASQTETINMDDVQPGTYVIRLSSGEGSAVQQIVKSN